MRDTLKYALAIAACVGVFFLGTSISERYLVPAAATTNTGDEPTPAPVQQPGARQALAATYRTTTPPPKVAYRWREPSGTWILTDLPPPEGVAAEVIPLTNHRPDRAYLERERAFLSTYRLPDRCNSRGGDSLHRYCREHYEAARQSFYDTYGTIE